MSDNATPALLVPPKEAARLLAVSPRKLWQMTFEDRPGLPHVRCGRLVRYSPAQLQAWLAERANGGRPAAGGGQ